jgi:hypothetical protein
MILYTMADMEAEQERTARRRAALAEREGPLTLREHAYRKSLTEAVRLHGEHCFDDGVPVCGWPEMHR